MLTVCRTQVRRPERPQRGSSPSPQPSRAGRLTVKVRLAAAGVNRLGGFPLSPVSSQSLERSPPPGVSPGRTPRTAAPRCASRCPLWERVSRPADLRLLAGLPSVPALSTSTPRPPGTPFSPSSGPVSGSVQGNIHNYKSHVSLQAPAFLQTENTPCQGQGGQATASASVLQGPSLCGRWSMAVSSCRAPRREARCKEHVPTPAPTQPPGACLLHFFPSLHDERTCGGPASAAFPVPDVGTAT